MYKSSVGGGQLAVAAGVGVIRHVSQGSRKVPRVPLGVGSWYLIITKKRGGRTGTKPEVFGLLGRDPPGLGHHGTCHAYRLGTLIPYVPDGRHGRQTSTPGRARERAPCILRTGLPPMIPMRETSAFPCALSTVSCLTPPFTDMTSTFPIGKAMEHEAGFLPRLRICTF